MNSNDRSFCPNPALFSNANILNRQSVLNGIEVKEFARFLETLLVARMVLDDVVGTHLMRHVKAMREL
ncbi:MAG: hypothetical protein IPL72_01190 [Sulfuritalea sp.]|nr:hypothetical protein [Sulfuritalea sp.]